MHFSQILENANTVPAQHEDTLICHCKKVPTLRVRPRIVLTTEIAYVRFECSCGTVGGLAITEEEAKTLYP